MQSKISFYTLFPTSRPQTLLKDPGFIPLYMSSLGYQVNYITCADIEEIFKNDNYSALRVLNFIQIDDDRKDKTQAFNGRNKNAIKFLWKHAREIDVLNVYFLKHSILYGLVYKLRNPKGILYVKLDMNPYAFIQKEKELIEPLRRWIFGKYLRSIPDLVSAESTAAYQYVQQRFLSTLSRKDEKLILVPNGVDDMLLEKEHVAVSLFKQRKNSFVVIGRIGDPIKRQEFIMEAATYITDWKDWKIELVGPINPEFEAYITIYFKQYPELKERVCFIGPIYDRKLLLSKYNESKVFIMSSKFESFGLAYVEAQYFGNYILSTPVSSIHDFIEGDNDLGLVVNSAEEMGRAMQDIIDGKNRIDDAFEKRVEHGQRFRWSTICKHLDDEIRKIFAQRK